jgi:hypothetical protein
MSMWWQIESVGGGIAPFLLLTGGDDDIIVLPIPVFRQESAWSYLCNHY